MLYVPVSVVLRTVILTYLEVNVVLNPWSKSWPMDMRFRLTKDGNTFERRAHTSKLGKGRRVVCDAQIDALFGSLTRMPLNVEYFFVHGVQDPTKWLVQPESTGCCFFCNCFLIFSTQACSAGFIIS